MSSEMIYKIKLAVAFLTVYLVWGSTYLAIKIAVKTLPPLIMGGVRFLLAGLILYIYARITGKEKENKTHWKNAIISGSLFFLVANGAVVIAIQYVDSGLVALMIAITPCWMVILDQFTKVKQPPGKLAIIGLVIGIVGLIILLNPFAGVAQEGIHLGGAGLILLGTIAWAASSIFTRSAEFPRSRGLMSSMQMLSGGALLLVAGILSGELNRINVENISTESILAFIYLVFFGSIIAFSAFAWLLKTTTPAKVGTYAYVNPVVAMILGVFFAGEVLGLLNIIAAVIILCGVVMISLDKMKKTDESLDIALEEKI